LHNGLPSAVRRLTTRLRQHSEQDSARSLSAQFSHRGNAVSDCKHGLACLHDEQIATGGFVQFWQSTLSPSRRAGKASRPQPPHSSCSDGSTRAHPLHSDSPQLVRRTMVLTFEQRAHGLAWALFQQLMQQRSPSRPRGR
jgi:hypothetical protein